MKALRISAVCLFAGLLPAGLAHSADDASRSPPVAQAPAAPKAGVSPVMREFEPPPVPEFMLRKPAQPLTQEEMRRQADQASERARRARAAAKPAPAPAEPPPAR